MPTTPQLHNIYIDNLVENRYAEEYELVKIDTVSNTYSLRKLATNEIILESIENLNRYYNVRVNYKGHF